MEAASAPILSTPAEHILQAPAPDAARPDCEVRLSPQQLHAQYEVERTVRDIRAGRWHRIALQFPDEMLVDAPRVFDALRDGLSQARVHDRPASMADDVEHLNGLAAKIGQASIADEAPTPVPDAAEKLTILGDTSYGACCVDEVAAEHVDAEVVVHYGRACLSPTARLPVIYVYTTKSCDLASAVQSFQQTYPQHDERVCLMADIPYSHHVPALFSQLEALGYTRVFATQVVRDPASPLPNRTLPPDVREDNERLREYSIFHISSPPTSLLLILSSRVHRIHVFDPNSGPAQAPETSAAQLLRRRYALVTRLSTASIYGILVNTLSVANYMSALRHVQDSIKHAGKKSYTFVVGKINAAKVANFAEVEGWVVIGCWESSLIESRDFWRPIVTPYELEVALTSDRSRTWGGEWIGDFSALLRKQNGNTGTSAANGVSVDGDGQDSATSPAWDEEPSDDEPPQFDLRTGRYVSHSRPMGRAKASNSRPIPGGSDSTQTARTSSALVQRGKGDIVTINGTVSPAAEFLRSKRTWQGLGSDYEIAYERDEDGKIRGAAMQEGRSGVAKGYTVGEDSAKT